MPNMEIQKLRALLASRPAADDLAGRRRNMDANAKTFPLDPAITVEAVSAGGVPAEWTVSPGADVGRVVLYLHGGGYVFGSILSHRHLVAEIGRQAGVRTLALDYRLAPEHPFPAAVEDALLAYGWLLSEGHAPGDIVVGGDSAGGGLALSMLLALREAKAEMPRAAVLMAPWTDLTVSSPSYEELRALDPIITRENLREAGLWYAGRRDPADPMASPLFADLTGLPPMLIHAGGDEAMLDDSRRFAERALAAGVKVDFKIWPGLWHVFQSAVPQVPEAAVAIAEIGDFVRAQYAA